MKTKICRICKNEFKSKMKTQLYCSTKCYRKGQIKIMDQPKHKESSRIREARKEAKEKLDRTKRIRRRPNKDQEEQWQGDTYNPPQSTLSYELIMKIQNLGGQLKDFGIRLTSNDIEKLKACYLEKIRMEENK